MWSYSIDNRASLSRARRVGVHDIVQKCHILRRRNARFLRARRRFLYEQHSSALFESHLCANFDCGTDHERPELTCRRITLRRRWCCVESARPCWRFSCTGQLAPSHRADAHFQRTDRRVPQSRSEPIFIASGVCSKQHRRAFAIFA